MKLLKNYWGLFIVILLSLLPLVSLLNSGLPLTHDGQDHVARIANFYMSLTEGNIIPRWAGNLNWGYGHPVLMFLYPASSYTASMFHFLGFSFVDSTKLVFAISFILSALTMYLWLKEFLTKEAAVVGALVYNFAPYRFVDLYIRGAIGEHVAFVFPPLVLYLILKIANSKNFNRFYFSFASLSIAGLILAHNAISIMFLPFIFLYGIYLIYYSTYKKSLIYQYIAILILGLMLSAFFLVPAYIEGKYTLRDVVTSGEALKRFVDITSVIYSPWNFGQSGQFSVQLGILQWLAVLGGAISLFVYKKNKKIRNLGVIILIYFLISIFIMLPQSQLLWEKFTLLQKFQFPWRFLSVSVFCASVLAALIANVIPKKFKTYIVVLVVAVALILSFSYWYPKGYLRKSETFYTGIYNGTTDTGESAPIWSVRFMEHRASAAAELIEGVGIIKQISRNSTDHIYETKSEGKTKFRENTLYFPGWRVYIDGNLKSDIEFQDPANRGLMTFILPAGEHKVEIKFTDTRIRMLSNYMSLASLIIILGIMLNTFALKAKKV